MIRQFYNLEMEWWQGLPNMEEATVQYLIPEAGAETTTTDSVP